MAGDPGKEGLLVMFGGRFLVERFQAFDMCVSSEGRADCKLPYLPFPSPLLPPPFSFLLSHVLRLLSFWAPAFASQVQADGPISRYFM